MIDSNIATASNSIFIPLVISAPARPMTALNRLEKFKHLPDPDSDQALQLAAKETFEQVATIRKSFKSWNNFYLHLKSNRVCDL